MRKFITIILAAAALCAVSCGKENSAGGTGSEGKSSAFRIVSSEITFEAQGGEGSIVFEADDAVDATSSRTWLSARVDGNTVRLTAAANSGYQSRYAKVSIKSSGTTLSLIAQQMGLRTPDLVPRESFFTLEEGWHIGYLADDEYEGEEISVIDISGTTGKFNYDIISSEDFSTLHGGSWARFIDSSAATVLEWCEENDTDPASRAYAENGQYSWPRLSPGTYAAVLYGVDDEFAPTGSYNYAIFTVSEAPGPDDPEPGPTVEFKLNADWKIIYNGRTSVNGTEYEHISYKVPTDAQFYPYLMTVSEYETRFGSNVEYFVGQIAAYMAQQHTELMRGPQELRHPRRNDGDYIVMAFGLNDDYTPTGDYQLLRFSIGQNETPTAEYQRWIGEWDVLGRNAAGTADSTFFSVKISAQIPNHTYAVNGWGGGYFGQFGNVLTTFDASTGRMKVGTFNVATGLDLESDGHSWVVGMYCFISYNGRELPVGGDYDIAEGVLSADASTATFTGLPMELSSGNTYEPLYMWWAGFSDDDRWTSYDGKAPHFPFTLKKK